MILFRICLNSESQSNITLLSFHVLLFLSLIPTTAWAITGNSSDSDKHILLDLKLFLQTNNPVNQGLYAEWNTSDTNHCHWSGISCNPSARVMAIYLNDSSITGSIFPNFSQFEYLTHLDLSNNTIQGTIPPTLNDCINLKYLNLSHNLITGELNLTELTQLEMLDLTLNRFVGGILSNFPALCTSLVTLNVSMNNFSGELTGCFDKCPNLKYLDLSSNKFNGGLWQGFERLVELSVTENNLSGNLTEETFSSNCTLQSLDISANGFEGWYPNSISNCTNLKDLNLWGNYFTGAIPYTLGSLSNLTTLSLGNNTFNREIPHQLLNCTKLVFIDLSRSNFTGDIQPIFGSFTNLKFLLLHSNSYTGGIESSRILQLQNLQRLDLSYNYLSGNLPNSISTMPNLKFLILAHNNFYGGIPNEYGQVTTLQALDLSFNNLTGNIPSTIGNLTSLLWLMLANNRLIGQIPVEIGNCKSLLWLNLANNSLTGSIPKSISQIGSDPEPTFQINREADASISAASGECLAMKRWIPATYPPFNFIYTLMTRKSCRVTWDRVLKGFGVFPVCLNSSSPVQSLAISGYLQLTGNQLSGTIPEEIGQMRRLSLIHFSENRFSGELPPQIGDLPLVLLNVSNNSFSGKIPVKIGGIKCLASLDLSFNNFSGDFAESLDLLSDLTLFNVSYNPLLSGQVPITGQMATFGPNSFLGDPMIQFLKGNRAAVPQRVVVSVNHRKVWKVVAFWFFLVIILASSVCAFLSFILCVSGRIPVDQDPDNGTDGLVRSRSPKWKREVDESLSSTSSDAVKVFRLDKTAFTYLDIVTATRNFSDEMVIGRGGYGIVYKGVLSDGRHVAVKKLERMGSEGEREFRAEMEVLTGRTGSGGPHPNLVVLHGWCLSDSERLLIYEYMEKGSLDKVISDWSKLTWVERLQIAVGVARGLVFLHHECQPAVVHRDVKASNVLLDRFGRARLTDFGLARVVSPGDSHVSTMVAGTVGYVAPEYWHTCRATTKGDVYSFGVLLMELATGRRAVDGGEDGLVEWVRRIGVQRVVESVGAKETKRLIEMWGLIKVAIWCSADAPHMRPDMRAVLAMILNISSNGICDKGNSDDDFSPSL